MKTLSIIAGLFLFGCSVAPNADVAVTEAHAETGGTVIPRNDDITNFNTQSVDGATHQTFTFNGRAGDFVQIELHNVDKDGVATNQLPPGTLRFTHAGREVAGRTSHDAALATVTLTVEHLPRTGAYEIETFGSAGFEYFMDFTSYIACNSDQGIRNNPACAAGRVCFNFDGWLRCTTPARPGDNCAESLSCADGYYCKGDMGDDDGTCTRCRANTSDPACH
jgi:hypothetical protein